MASRLASSARTLWTGGDVTVAHVSATPTLSQLLATLQGRGQVERGLENIAKILASEQHGQQALNAKQGTDPAFRISRILLMADSGSERFNRDCEKLLRQHAERLLGLRLDDSGTEVFENLFGTEATAKAILISHKDAVAQTLLALVDA